MSAPQQFFQAIGAIRGKVAADENNGFKVILPSRTGDVDFRLGFMHGGVRKAFSKSLSERGGDRRRLLVYPRVIHFPQRDRDHVLYFVAVAFDDFEFDLDDGEFHVSGAWQKIGCYAWPLVSVYRNRTEQTLAALKGLPDEGKYRMLKASHLPLLWRNPDVPAFRYDPKLGKGKQPSPPFVSVRAKLLPDRKLFGCQKVLAVAGQVPPHLKVKKGIKTRVLKARLAAMRQTAG